MHKQRITRSAALGLALAALAAPTAVAQQDLRGADAQDAARSATAGQGQPPQDLRSPDARDSAAGRGTFSAPEVTVVKVSAPTPPSGGLDWGDAGIGAGGVLGLALLALGGILAVIHHRRAGTGGRPTAMG